MYFFLPNEKLIDLSLLILLQLFKAQMLIINKHCVDLRDNLQFNKWDMPRFNLQSAIINKAMNQQQTCKYNDQILWL